MFKKGTLCKKVKVVCTFQIFTVEKRHVTMLKRIEPTKLIGEQNHLCFLLLFLLFVFVTIKGEREKRKYQGDCCL